MRQPLAPYATLAEQSRGRLFTEPPSAARGPYQRDRDRIIHSGAFRKLRNKTQVFIESEGDYYRTRLTHSIEVAQIARAIARQLQIDEDLTEAVALAHDLGHTCFGHAGEHALDRVMKNYGGFDHNDQAFRILTKLEQRYPAFDGLNLTWETLEGVVKHNGPLKGELPTTIKAYPVDLELGTWCGLEAQVASLADDIAYNTHDMDDGVRSGLIKLDDLAGLPVFSDIMNNVRTQWPKVETERLIYEIVRQAIGLFVDDLLLTTRAAIDQAMPHDAAAVRRAGKPLVTFSDELKGKLKTIKAFLMQRLYKHERVLAKVAVAETMMQELFEAYMAEPKLMGGDWPDKAGRASNDVEKARIVADYVAGMTDRFVIRAYKDVLGKEVKL